MSSNNSGIPDVVESSFDSGIAVQFFWIVLEADRISNLFCELV
jgi:hypothetical protein